MAIIDKLCFIPKADPLGNGQETVEIGYDSGDGTILTGGYISVHGGGPLNLRFVHGNPVDSPGGTAVGDVFELAGGRVALVEQ